VRHGMIGVSDSPPLRGVAILLAYCVAVVWVCWFWLKRGYRLKP